MSRAAGVLRSSKSTSANHTRSGADAWIPYFNCCTVFASSPADARSTVPSATCQGINHQSPREPPRRTPRQRTKRGRPGVLPWRAASVLTRDQRSAGRIPIAAADASDTPNVNITTLRSGETSRSPGVNRLAIIGASARAIHVPSRPPATPPSAASNRCSASSWRSNRTRPAPSDDRIASSFCRACTVVPSNVETLRQADDQDQNREETNQPQTALGRRCVPAVPSRESR